MVLAFEVSYGFDYMSSSDWQSYDFQFILTNIYWAYQVLWNER